MKKVISVSLLLCLLLVSCNAQEEERPIFNVVSVASPQGTDVFQPNWTNIAQNYQYPEWFCDAKFGIFIHWGVYSVPAFVNEWYSRNMYMEGSNEYKHHIATYGEQTKFGYKDFIPMFKGEKFDA
jgi:alpha-L-fucosidase